MKGTIDQTVNDQMTKEQFEQSMQGSAIRQQANPDLTGKVRDFYDELKEYDGIKDQLERNSEYGKLLEQHVNAAYEKYKSNLEALSTKANTALKGLGIAGDAYFFYDPIGGLGIKAISTVGRTVVELPNLFSYVGKSHDYLSMGAFAVMKAASYLPGFTIADLGMKHIVKRRILKEARQNFLKEIGVQEPSYLDKLKEVYTNVKERVKNVFTPEYEPAVQTA